jgi:G3E family GTPase
MNVCLLKTDGGDASARQQVEHHAVLTFSDEEHAVEPGQSLAIGAKLQQLQLPEGTGEKVFPIIITEPGYYALFTEHGPDEFSAQLVDGFSQPQTALATHEYKPDHEHDEEVSSVGIVETSPVNPTKLNAWLSQLLQEKGPDIFRMKGVLLIQGESKRFVFQGVHMLFDGRPDRPWKPQETKQSKMIFIGRNLDREALTKGFRNCLA